MAGGVRADDDDHRGPGPAGVVQVGQAVGQARPEVQEHGCGLAGDPGVAVGGAGGDALEQRQHPAHLRHRNQRADEVHLLHMGTLEGLAERERVQVLEALNDLGRQLRERDRTLVLHALEHLDEPCREIIELRYFGDLSYEEISRSLKLNVKTVSSRLSKCLDKLELIVKGLFAPELREKTSTSSV